MVIGVVVVLVVLFVYCCGKMILGNYIWWMCLSVGGDLKSVGY